MARTLVVWCPDWPLTAAGVPPDRPAVVLAAERVVVCSAAARAFGVRVGIRRREAQARCPELETLPADPARDARGFGPVVAAAVALVPHLEVVRPGLLALAVRGPARAFGGEEQVAARLAAEVDAAVAAVVAALADDGEVVAAPRTRVGVADTRFAAVLAARRADLDAAPPLVAVPVGGDAAFLAPLAITTLVHGAGTAGVGATRDEAAAIDELVELLRRLGIRDLGTLATLPATSVADRFGSIGLRAHRQAQGRDERRVVALDALPDHEVRVELEEPAAQVEAIAFAARRPAEALVERLTRLGLTCTLLAIEAETDHAEQLARRWRATDGFTPALVVDRVRWQLDGWLSGSAGAPQPTAGIVLLRLTPVEVVDGGQQASLLNEAPPTSPQVVQAVTRLQGMLGPDAVLVGVPAGGRDPASWVVPVPWGEHEAARHPVARATDRPWPGHLPSPAPATVPPRRPDAEVVDVTGTPVGVSGRGEVTAPPVRVRVDDGPWRQIIGWAGPWPADERWWEATGRRRARFQVATDDGAAWLLALERGRWQAEAIYD